MSTQRMIKDSFWTDSYISNLDPIEKLIFIYLLTNPLCNIAGIYEIQTRRIAFDTGIDKDMVDKILKRLEKDGKIIRNVDWLLITNHVKHQSFKNPNVSKGIQRIIDDLPDEVKALKGFERLSHFTLLNLTLPNLTQSSEGKEKSSGLSNLIPEVIKAFESVDPKNKNYYGNKNQRAASEFLLAEYGLEEVIKRISFLPKSNTMEFFPSITTPVQLRDKWVALENAVGRIKNKTNVVAF